MFPGDSTLLLLKTIILYFWNIVSFSTLKRCTLQIRDFIPNLFCSSQIILQTFHLHFSLQNQAVKSFVDSFIKDSVCCIHLGKFGGKSIAYSLHYSWLKEMNSVIFVLTTAT